MTNRPSSNARPDWAEPLVAAPVEGDDTGWLITFSDLVLQLFAFVLVAAVAGGTARHVVRQARTHTPAKLAAAAPAGHARAARVIDDAPAQRPDALSEYQPAPRPDPLGALEANAWAGDNGGDAPCDASDAASDAAAPETPPADALAAAATGSADAAGDAHIRNLGTYLDAFVTARGDADDATVVVGDSDVRLDFGGRLGFRAGSTDLMPAGIALVHELQRIASGIPNLTIEVSGYTDDLPIHTREFPSNLELSLARAARVAREIERGDPSLAVRTVALGFAEHRAIAPNDGPENRARNRRVEVRLVARD
jgi:flagellar motor protein MotB